MCKSSSSAFFTRIKCLSVEMHVFLNFIIMGRGSAPSPHSTPSFFQIKFYFKNVKFYNANQCVPRRHKNSHLSEWATFEKYWYAQEYKAPLFSTSTNFLQPGRKHINILALEMASPGNRHCASCIGALPLPVANSDLYLEGRHLGRR